MRGPGKSAAAQLLLEVHAKGLQTPPNPRMVHPEGSGLLGVRDMGFSVLGPQGWWIPLGTGWSGAGGGLSGFNFEGLLFDFGGCLLEMDHSRRLFCRRYFRMAKASQVDSGSQPAP